MSCDRSDYYKINILPCSGHGDCIDNKCYCYNHWTGEGDYELDPHFDCDINYQVIRILSIITLILFCINLITISRALLKIKFSFKHIGRDTKLTIYLCFLCDILGHGISCVAKIINPVKYVLGASNGVVNLGNNLFFIFCGLGWCYYYQIFTGFIQGYSKMVDKQYRDQITSRSILIDNYIKYIMIFPIISITSDDFIFIAPKHSDLFAIGNLMGLLCVSGSFMIASELTMSVFINEIGKYLNQSDNQDSSNNGIITIYKRMRVIRYILAVFFFLAVLTCGIFSFWSYLRRKISYLHQCLHISVALLEGLLAYILLPKSTYIASIRRISAVKLSSSLRITDFTRRTSVMISNYMSYSSKVVPVNSNVHNINIISVKKLCTDNSASTSL